MLTARELHLPDTQDHKRDQNERKEKNCSIGKFVQFMPLTSANTKYKILYDLC